MFLFVLCLKIQNPGMCLNEVCLGGVIFGHVGDLCGLVVCQDLILMKWACMSGVFIFCHRFAACTAVCVRRLHFCIHDFRARGVLVFHWASGVSNMCFSDCCMHCPWAWRVLI